MKHLTRTAREPLITTYEVQHYTHCDGWINTWMIEHPDGTSEPERFDCFEAAQAALDEFMAEIAEEIENGTRGHDEGFDLEEYRIVRVAVPS